MQISPNLLPSKDIAYLNHPAYSAASQMESSMTTSSSQKIARPLSPHLQIYKPQLTSGMSIFHRITGVALAFALPVFVAWLVVVAGGPQVYADFMKLFQTLLGQILLYGWMFAFFYHFCCGIRHLLWDAGYGLNLRAVYISGYIAIGLSLLATASVWFKVHGMFA